MSKRPFKAQASSSRVAPGPPSSGFGGFGGFGPQAAGSSLSYFTEPPNLSLINDPNVAVNFKNLSRKNATTKSKALEDLTGYVRDSGGPEEAILEAWVKLYPRLAIDNSRRVRELSHVLQYELLKSARKRMEKFIPKVVGSWLAGTYDRDRSVARAAADGIASFLDTEEKVTIFWKRCQAQILDHALEAINETPESLSDERSMSPDEVQATYFRVAWSSISLVLNMLVKLGKEDIIKQQEKYEEYLAKNKRLWALASSEDSFVRRAVGQLLVVCLEKQPDIIDAELELISTAFIAEALRSSQSSSAVQLVHTLEKLTAQFPHTWTTSYKGKKAPLSRLRAFVEKGSQGGSSEYWQSLRSLFQLLPTGILPVELDSSIEFLHALRQGIGHREEPRSNATEAWLTYFESVKLLASKLSDSTLQAKLYQESLFPLFEQYLRPTAENSKWSTGNSSVLLIKAFEICASATSAELQQSFASEWQRLSTEFIVRIQTSLPEQSKDYHKSQAAIAAEGHRWFNLVSGALKADQSQESNDWVAELSSKIISTSLETIVKRNGKPYSAAAVVEGALRYSPALLEISSESLASISSFVENRLPELITSPSSNYLISILNLFRLIPSQDTLFQKVWLAVVDELYPISDQSQKWKVVTALISNDAVANLAQNHPALQILCFDTTVKAVEGNADAWPLFEAAITFSSLSPQTEAKIVGLVLESLDTENAHADGALRAIEFLSSHKPSLLRQESTIHVGMITKLLALTELSDSSLSTRASRLRGAMETSDKASSPSERESPILHVIRENLEYASPQSLAIETLVQQAESILKGAAKAPNTNAILPDPVKWSELLQPFLDISPSPALGVMRPFAGTVFLVHPSPSSSLSLFSRDLSGYSSPLRMAMYTLRLLDNVYASILPSAAVEILYLLNMTSQLVQDQLDLNEENGLFASTIDPDIMTELREFVFASRSSSLRIIPDSKSWQDDFDKAKNGAAGNSGVAGTLLLKFFETTNENTPVAFYAARALSDLLQTLVNAHGWHNTSGDLWLQKLDVLKSSTKNTLGAVSLLTGLQENLRTSKFVSNMCNRLISDITGVSAQSDRTLGLIVLLNASLAIYDEGDLPVAQNRLVFALQQILSWVDAVADDNRLASEMFRALHRLLPAIKEVYGSYWETSLGFCISTWEANSSGAMTDDSLPMIGMSLKLYTILRTLDDANDDLEDALRQLGYQISQGLVGLLRLRRLKDSLPLTYTDDLLAREVNKIPLDHIKNDLSDIYPLVASEFRMVQSAAFDILHRALPAAQQQLSVDVLLEKRDAQLPEELLSLLLDAPSVQNLAEDFREDFPASVRAYLLSWHLVYDLYGNSSFKVRNDYSDHLRSEGCIGPLLEFIFDSLTHGGNRQSISGFDSTMIRSYDMWQAMDSESNERNLEWLLTNLYYLCLRFTPSLAKSWWVDCKSKRIKLAMEALTRKSFSPLVIEETLDEVAKWSEEQEINDDEKELIIKISKRSREVFAGYEIDDMMMQIVIRLPESYPLEGVKVDGVNRVAVSEKKWISWMRIAQGVITFSNGSITDGLNIFRKNVIGALKGQTECAICYSIISSDKKMPDKRCQTCKNLFHSSCLFKWFASSNQSTCPLCRNPFNYGADTSRKALDRS